MQFLEPRAFYLLLLTPLTTLLFLHTFRWKSKSKRVFADTVMAQALFASVSQRRQWIKGALLVTTTLLLSISLARPTLANRETIAADRADIIALLDVSLSMATEDVSPNRLEKAKREIAAFVGRLQGDRVGLAIFAGSSSLRYPMTTDYDSAKLLLDGVNVDSAPTSGTNVGEALQLAVGILRQSPSPHRFILLVSDGENLAGDPAASAQDAKTEGIILYTIGVGTREGGPIPIVGQRGERVYKLDAAGGMVNSRMDEAALTLLSSETDGRSYRATSGQGEVGDLYREISIKTRGPLGDATPDRGDLYQVFALLALLTLFLEPLVIERRTVAS